MSLTMQVGQTDTGTLSAFDAAGNPAAVPVPESWTVSPAGVVALAVAPDTKSVVATAVAPGTCTVTATGGGLSVSDTVTVTVPPPPPPASLNLTWGTPQ